MNKFKLASLSFLIAVLPALFQAAVAREPFSIDNGLRLVRSYQANEVQWFKRYISGRNWDTLRASFEDDDE